MIENDCGNCKHFSWGNGSVNCDKGHTCPVLKECVDHELIERNEDPIMNHKKVKIYQLIMIIVLIICAITGIIYMLTSNKKLTDRAVNKAVEEFTFDYNEEIITTKLEVLGDCYIITIYGEKTLVHYIYKNGEIWNYENGSN